MVIRNKEIEKFIIIIFFVANFLQLCDITANYELLADLLKYVASMVAALYWFATTIYTSKLSVLIWQFSLGGIILYTSFMTDNFSLVITYLLIVVIKNLSVKEYMELIMKCQACQIILAVLIWLIGILCNLTPVYFNARVRTIGFCFGHPNNVSMKLLWCCTAYLFLADMHTKEKRLRRTIAAEIIGFCTTRSDIFLFGGLIIVLYVLKEKKWIVRIVNMTARVVFPLLGGFVYAMVFYYDRSKPEILVAFSKKINQFSNWRIAMSSLAHRYNNITWLGSSVTYNHQWEIAYPFGNYTIDILYTYLLVSIGIVYFLIISYGLYKLARKENYIVSLSIMLFALCALAEVSVLYITSSYGLMMLKVLIFGSNDLENKGRNPHIRFGERK